MTEINSEESTKIIINPYNFNNKLLQKSDIKSILSDYKIDFDIQDLSIYQQAFSHKSYCQKNPEDVQKEDVELAEKPEGCLELRENDNERLEYLGDSVISCIIAKYLFERFPDQDEGFMTRLRTKLVNGEMLGRLSLEIGFDKFVLISRHVEERCNGRSSVRILEDVFESFVGSLFLDFNNNTLDTPLFDNLYSGPGFHICELFIINLIESKIDFSDLILTDYNYKDQLLRFFQQKFQETPKYKEVMLEGPPHDRIYTMGVLDTQGDIICEGKGKSKKKAEQLASKKCLVHFGIIDETIEN